MPSNDNNTDRDVESTIDPTDWAGIQYDGDSGTFVEVTFNDDGTVAVTPEGSAEPTTTYESHAAFRDHETELLSVPEHAVENPVAVAEDVYAKGFEELLSHYHANDIAILYADQHTTIVETDE